MPLKNTLTRYGALAQLFHWTIVALIIVQYLLMQAAEDLPLGLKKFKLFAVHKSVGITILALAILRLLWRWMNPVPAPPATLRPWEVAVARGTHYLLYALLFAMPLSGWLMSNAQNSPVSYFGWFTLPDLLSPNRELGHLLEETHEILFLVLATVATLHVLAALRHHFWIKDGVLKRMLPFTSAMLLLMTVPQLAQAATTYTMDAARSTLAFTFTQTGAQVPGRFQQFQAIIAFSPEDLPGSRFEVRVSTASVDTGEDDRDAALRGEELFAVEKFPIATFIANRFVHHGDSRYVATGRLTLRGVSRDIEVPFTFERSGSSAGLKGKLDLDRLEYGIGQGEWKDTSMVGARVTVSFDLHLKPAPDS